MGINFKFKPNWKQRKSYIFPAIADDWTSREESGAKTFSPMNSRSKQAATRIVAAINKFHDAPEMRVVFHSALRIPHSALTSPSPATTTAAAM
jgi:hypothetical protein